MTCFGRPFTTADPDGTGTPYPHTPRGRRYEASGRNRQGSPCKCLRGTTAGRDAHTVPLGTVLLREWAPVGSAGTGSLGCQRRQEGGRSRVCRRSFPGSPGKPASVGTPEARSPRIAPGCSRVRPSGAPAHRHRDKQRSTRGSSKPSIERSPRKHRAMRRRKRQRVVTDLTVEQSPEVERPITANRSGTLRSRTVPGRRARIVNNGERARTAVARARRLQCPAWEERTRFTW